MTAMRRFWQATVLAAFLTAVAAAQSKPDFTGTWRMNVEKSAFDRQGPPKGVTVLKVTHQDPKFAETIFHHEPEPKEMGRVEYVTDGSEGSNVMMGNRMKCTAKWEGRDLVITTWGSFGQNEMRLTDRWQLGAGGKVLTILRKYEGQGGTQQQTLIFEPEAAK